MKEVDIILILAEPFSRNLVFFGCLAVIALVFGLYGFTQTFLNTSKGSTKRGIIVIVLVLIVLVILATLAIHFTYKG